jgi:hypothetical protein
MMTLMPSSSVTPLNAARRRLLSSALDQVLHPAQLTAARELMRAEAPARLSPRPEEILYWMRVNMPQATLRVEAILHSHE